MEQEKVESAKTKVMTESYTKHRHRHYFSYHCGWWLLLIFLWKNSVVKQNWPTTSLVEATSFSPTSIATPVQRSIKPRNSLVAFGALSQLALNSRQRRRNKQVVLRVRKQETSNDVARRFVTKNTKKKKEKNTRKRKDRTNTNNGQQRQRQQQPNTSSSSPSYKQQLQKCVTPHDVLTKVAPKINPITDPTGDIASLILVRLAKQLIILDNHHRAIASAATNTATETDATTINHTNSKWYDDLIQDQSILEQLSNSLATVMAENSDKHSQDTNRADLLPLPLVEACVEGLKSAAIISRIIPEFISIWKPLLITWENQYATRVVSQLQPHQVSAIKYAYDCFQAVSNIALTTTKTSCNDVMGNYINDNEDSTILNLPTPIREAYDQLDLPFRVRPSLFATMIDPSNGSSEKQEEKDTIHQELTLSVSNIVQQVNFRVDDIRSASNEVVKERRQTAWEGDDGVDPFAYSGKSMATDPWSPVVQSVRDGLFNVSGIYYQGCLLNLYPDGGSGMRYHIDPDQGTLWGFETAVVSVGATRKFAFRSIPSSLSTQQQQQQNMQKQPHTFVLMEGDVTEMFGDCQTRFQHTVKTAEDKNEKAPRASLVFKRTLPNNKK